MNVWGKVIGAATGFALHGPEGSIFGALCGHAIDMYTSWAEEYGPSYRQSNSAAKKERRNAASRYNFTVSVVTLAAKLAKVDGPVTRTEVSAFKEIFKVPPEEASNVGRIFDRARASSDGFEPYANQLASSLENQRGVLDEVIGCLLHVALADGPMKAEETNYIYRVTKIFGFSESYFQRRLEERGYTIGGGNNKKSNGGPPPSLAPDPYVSLGLKATATDAEIKTAYRKLVRENHPDRLVASGKPKDVIDKATAKLAKINAAYEQIIRERNIR